MQVQCPNCGSYYVTRQRQSMISTTQTPMTTIGGVMMLVTLLASAAAYFFVVVPFNLGKSWTAVLIILAITWVGVPIGILALLSRLMKRNLFKGDLVWENHCEACNFNWRAKRSTVFGDR